MKINNNDFEIGEDNLQQQNNLQPFYDGDIKIDANGLIDIWTTNSFRDTRDSYASIFFEPKTNGQHKVVGKKMEVTENNALASKKHIKIVIKCTRSKINDLKTSFLPAPSTKVRQSLFNLRIVSTLFQNSVPKLPPNAADLNLNKKTPQHSSSRRIPQPPPMLKTPKKASQQYKSIYLRKQKL